MSRRPDLSIPALPDPEDIFAPADAVSASVPVHAGGMSVREPGAGEDGIEWPEAGPSRLPAISATGGKDGSEAVMGPFGAKMVAAMTGAMMTSLLMTPFDVLKTRLQTVQPDPYQVIPRSAPATDCCQTSLITPRRLGSASSSASATATASATASASASASAAKKPNFTCFTSMDEIPLRYGRSAQARAAFSSLTSAALSGAGTGAGAVTIPAPAAPRGCSFPSKWAGMWGEAVTLEEALARAGRSRLQTSGVGAGFATLVLPGTGTEAKPGFWSEVGAVRREVGVRGLWKGVGPTLTMSIPSSAIYMIGYEHLLGVISPMFISSSDPDAHVSSLNRAPGAKSSAGLSPAPLVAGSLARTVSATVISPIEMFRTRLQALPIAGVSPTYASTFKAMGELVRAQGPTVLWRGLGPTLWRDVPFSGIYWAGFEILKTNLTETQPALSPLTTSFLSGALSGTVSALVTQPFDVLKTRRQVFTPSPGCSPAALKHRASTLPLALHMIRTEGWGALFAGVVPRCGKVAPACGLMIACYEGVGRYLGGK